MEELRFADILMILVVCGVIFGILALTRRADRKPKKNLDGIATWESGQDLENSSEDD